MSYIKIFGLNGTYKPSYRQAIYESGTPYGYMTVNSEIIDSHKEVIIKAQLTQTLNTGGSFTLTLRKGNSSIHAYMALYTLYCEVYTPYNMDGQESSAAEHPERLNRWRGVRTMTVEYPDRYDVIFEGELSYLSKIVVEPYETTNMTTSQFVEYMLGKYNANTPVQTAYLQFGFTSSNCDEGDSVVRSNSSITTVWDDINEKVLKKYNNQISICNYPDTEKRYLCMRGLPTTPSGVINGQDILSVSHSTNAAERARTWYAYGAQSSPAEGDINRIREMYYQYTDYSSLVPAISQMYRVYDEITTRTTLDTRAEELYEQALLNSDGIDLTIHPDKASELLLGSLYTVSCSKAGISGEYRLTKRVIDVLNPARNKYTFGTAQKLISTR